MVYRIKSPRTFCLLVSALLLFWLQLKYEPNIHSQILNSNEYRQKVLKSDPRPLVVVGVLSNDEFFERRHTLRQTWIGTINKLEKELPFRIKYNFFSR